MSEYIFDEHERDEELVRLRMIEELFDPTTIRHLDRTGVRIYYSTISVIATK